MDDSFTNPMAFAKALKVSDVPAGGVAKATVNKREIAIVNRGGDFFALDGVCTHEAGPLGEGALDGDELVCPWHEGRYRIDTGEASPDTDWVTDIKSFPVKVEGGYVWVDL
jgi:nitrite reductase/ring-hydroxylating ferredoxin subunit